MRFYLISIIVLVGICHKIPSAELPSTSNETVGPIVFLPANIDYAESLIHRYNAQAVNPNLIVPSIETLLSDGKRGFHAWLKSNPDLSLFNEELVYPLHIDHRSQNGVFLLKLPPDQNTQISFILQERLNRFIQYTCLSDGFPIPRPNHVKPNDYSRSNTQQFLVNEWVYIIITIALLALCFFKSRRSR